jgi:hypothetical protein
MIPMNLHSTIRRYLWVLGLIGLSGCADLPTSHPDSFSDGMPLLRLSAAAHGDASLKRMHDVNVSYSGQWSGLIKKIQPVLIDDSYRGGSDERMLLKENVIAQRHVGSAGTKQVYRDAGTVHVWRNDVIDRDAESLAAAALVADDYRLFLLGPMVLVTMASRVENVGTTTVDGRLCNRLLITLTPGLGQSSLDRVELDVDHETHLAKRLRISLEGLASTQGAVAQIDVSDYISAHGVKWPTHFVESLVKPIGGLPIHDWHLTGLDVDRGYSLDEISGPQFAGAARSQAGTADIRNQ